MGGGGGHTWTRDSRVERSGEVEEIGANKNVSKGRIMSRSAPRGDEEERCHGDCDFRGYPVGGDADVSAAVSGAASDESWAGGV